MIPGGLDILAKNMGRTAARRRRSTDMITRTIKYTASDGTEHDSPQAAAQKDLRNYLCKLIEQCWPGISSRDLDELTTGLARNPEALRDALDAYFEDLEAHPDVDDLPFCKWDPIDALRDVTLTAPPHPSGLRLTEAAQKYTEISTGHSVEDWIVAGWTREQLLDHGLAVEVKDVKCDGEHFPPACKDPQCWHKQPLDDGEIAPGVRGFEMEVPKGSNVAMDYASGSDWSAGAVVYKPAPLGDPDDPSTWAVDHPQYCRPFGTRED